MSPFLVERPADSLPAAVPVTVDVAAVAPRPSGNFRFVFRGVALQPVLTAGVAALTAMTAIGLFLGLLLGETF